jgi:electron transfer flavoprotein alpha subunit
MTGDCVAIDIAKAGRLLQTKPAYGGNIVSVIMGRTTPQLATVRARMYEPLEPRDDAEAEMRTVSVDEWPERDAGLLEERRQDQTGLDLDAADVVLFAGPEAELDELTEVPVGGSHPELPAQRRVGLYGRPVAPRLLVAVGLDATPEDLSGFVKAAVVVALGSEPVDWADVTFGGDWRAIV